MAAADGEGDDTSVAAAQLCSSALMVRVAVEPRKGHVSDAWVRGEELGNLLSRGALVRHSERQGD